MRRNEPSLYSKKQSTPISLRALFYVRKRSMRTSPPASKNHHQHKLSIMARHSSRLALNVAIQMIAGDFLPEFSGLRRISGIKRTHKIIKEQVLR